MAARRSLPAVKMAAPRGVGGGHPRCECPLSPARSGGGDWRGRGWGQRERGAGRAAAVRGAAAVVLDVPVRRRRSPARHEEAQRVGHGGA